MNRAHHRFSWRILAEMNLGLREGHLSLEKIAKEVAKRVASQFSAWEKALPDYAGTIPPWEKEQPPQAQVADLVSDLEDRIYASLAHTSQENPTLPLRIRVLVEENPHSVFEGWGVFLIEKGSRSNLGQHDIEIYLYSEGIQAGA